MRVVLPEVGRTGFRALAASSTEYMVLGPFAVGAFLRRLWFSVSASADGAMEISAVLGPSGEASAVAFAAGAPLIDTSDNVLGGQPSVLFSVVRGVAPQMVVPCGRRVTEGGRYVIVACEVGVAPAASSLLAGIEVLRMTRVLKDRGE